MSQVEQVSRVRSRATGLLLCAALSTVFVVAPAPPLAAQAPASSGSSAIRLEPAIVPAAGRQVAELEVAEFGRYSIRVASARGTALQVVDRMSGAGEVYGEAGKSDGRVDLFLDRGAVRLITWGSKLATGEATLSAVPFRERVSGNPSAASAGVQLVEGKEIDVELADLEQISWWIEIPKRRRVVFEAAGRNLADLRLWQNGSWLVDAAPVTSVVEPRSGRPLSLCQLTADLPPGLYRLTAYGGPEIPWASAGSGIVERPFHLRFGWSRDAQTLRERRTIGPLGFDRVLVSGVADYFRLELPEAPVGEATVQLELATVDPQDPFATGGPSTAITKENVPPVGEISTAADPDRETLVTVRGVAGQPYVLQHFARTRERELNARAVKSEYWISTVHAGPVEDAIEPTAILVRRGDGAKRKSEVIAGETVELSRVAGWARRFNLLDAATLFVRVHEASTYVVRSTGTAAQFRFEPLFIDAYPEGWQQPPMRSAPAEWQLDPGYYVFFLQPVEAGIAEIELAPKGVPTIPVKPSRPSVQLGVQPLNAKLGYHLYLSQQPGVEAGMVVRELPLDLAAALPLALGSGEEVELLVRAAERSSVRALTEEGGTLEVSIDGQEWAGRAVGSPAALLEPGEHRLQVRSTSDKTVLASVGLVAEARLASTPLPELPAATLAALPKFPHLGTAAAQTLDLEAGEVRTFVVEADDPALYRIESTGLLATGGALRTRTRANLLSQAENGVGRNFALAAFLREGDYQLTVQPRGASAGHLGLAMAHAPIEEAGSLTEGVAARATIAPGRALSYRWSVAEAGSYSLYAWGLRSGFAMRLEDADGWPVAAPLATGELAVDLEAGDYRLIVLPQAVEARAVVTVARAIRPLELSGHGPHPLTLDREASNLWLEPEGDGERVPDRWRFRLPATTGVTISLSDEMMGVVRLLQPSGTLLPNGGLVPPGRGFHGELPAGEYELAAESSRSNNRLSYRVSVRTDDLVDGGTRIVRAPGEIWLAVGAAGQVELASFGRSDVRATLLSAVGEPIAASDDRPGDWNFLLGERLVPGRYRLRIEPVGASSASTAVAMRVLKEREEAPLAALAPASRRGYEVAEDAVLVPLELRNDAEIVAIGARAGESLGLALEERTSNGGDSWRVLDSASGRAVRLALPLSESTAALRLRIWSLDRRAASVDVTAFGGPMAHRSEADLARGFALEPLAGVDPLLAVAQVDLAEPGCFRREIPAADFPAGADLLQALGAGSTFEHAAPTLAPVGFAMPLAVATEEGQTVRVQARRARVGEGEPLALALPAGTPITCDVADGGAAVVELEAMAGEPVVGFLDGRGTVGPSSALSLSGGGRVRSAKSAGQGRAVELWNSGASTVEARLSGWLATPVAARRLNWGSAQLTVAAGAAVLLELPQGEKDLRVTLAPGSMVLALAPATPDGADDAEGTIWAPVEATTESLMTVADRLLFVGGESSPGELSVEILHSSAGAGRTAAMPDLSVTDQQRFEERFSFTGAFRVPVSTAEAGGARRLHLRGAGAALFVGGDGSVQRGTDFEVTSAGGSLRFEHPPGLVSAWIDDGEDEPAGIVANAAGEPERELTLPATIDLAGATATFVVVLDAPALLKARGTAPLAIAVGSPVIRSEVYPEGARFDAVLPAGRSTIAIRGLAGEDLTGRLTLVADSLVPLGEGLGEESLLAPGDSRGYSFRVARSGAVGVGVRADQGGVETRLFEAGGRFLGQGVVQWREFDAGAFVLVVTAPAEGSAARVRPALVGASPPGSGPPPEEARRFLQLAGAVPPGDAAAAAQGGVAGAEDLPEDWLGVRAAEDTEEEESYDSSDENYDSSYDEENDEMPDEGEWDEESESSDDGSEDE